MENDQIRQETKQPAVDPKYYLRIAYRRRWLILAFFASVVGASTVYSMRQQKVYSASVSMIIDVAAPRFLDSAQVTDVTGDTATSNYWYNREYYETQNKVITSRSVSQRVVDKLGLQSDVTFLGLEKIKDEKQRDEIAKTMDPASILLGKIRVQPVKESRVLYIAVEDTEPNRAALLANEVADAYVAETLSLKMQVTDNASRWLDERRETLESKTKTSEMAVYNYKKDSDVLTVSLEDRQSMVTQRLEALNANLTEVRIRIAGLKARVDSVEEVQKTSKDDSGRWAEGLPAAADNQLVQSYKVRLANQSLECAELKDRYLADHPKLSACLEKQKSAEQDLLRELGNIVVAARADLREALTKEKNLSQMLDLSKAEAFEVNKKQIEYDQLKRDSDNNQRLYDVVIKRLKDIELSSLLRTSNVRILDLARPNPAPIRPNVRNIFFLSIILGLIGGFALAMVLELLDNSVVTQADVEERIGLPFLGFIPRIASNPNDPPNARDLYVHRQPKSSVAECCRAVRTNLLFMSPDKPLTTILVTSSGPQEGKSTTVVNMGIGMAQSGNRVLLIDTDMRRPRLHKAFGVSNEVGVSSLVVGEGTIEDAIKTTEVPGLFVLPCGPIPPNPAELLHTAAFNALLKKFTEKFDRVILDSPPIGAVTDAIVLSTQASGVVLVIKGGQTNREVAKRAVRSLQDVKARLFGAVLNDINLEDSKYGDYYYAYRRYGYYYGGGEKKDEAVS